MNRQEDTDRSDRSKPPSRRNSASLSRRSSLKEREKDTKKSPLNTAPSSANSTPKKTASIVSTPKKNVTGNNKGGRQNIDFVVTGKQILKKSDRANSLPGTYHRRQSTELIATKKADSPKRIPNVSESSRSRETSLEDDMSLDLSQVSDFEDTNSKYGLRKFAALATSTPKPPNCKPRSASLQNQLHSLKLESRRALKSQDSSKNSREMSLSYSRESFMTSSTGSPHRYTTELDYSSVSPEYSGQSSTDLSPTRASQIVSPRSQDLQMSSCCVSTWQDCSEDRTKVEGLPPTDGEWTSFWANYNNSLAKVPLKQYYDQCPTPYRTENFDLADFELSDGSRKRSPDNIQAINNIICHEGLHLTPRETQNMIKCAHLLGNVLSKAMERRTRNDADNPELLIKKQTMTLDLKETALPVNVEEEKRCESATQTDISLPNTKAAPRIFENILRQLSRSSIDVEKITNKDETVEKTEKKDE